MKTKLIEFLKTFLSFVFACLILISPEEYLSPEGLKALLLIVIGSLIKTGYVWFVDEKKIPQTVYGKIAGKFGKKTV
jgi:hypothetical protein